MDRIADLGFGAGATYACRNPQRPQTQNPPLSLTFPAHRSLLRPAVLSQGVHIAAVSVTTGPGGTVMASENRGVAYIKPGEVRGPVDRLPQAGQPDQQEEGRARRDPQDRLDQHLRLRPAHGPRPHDRPGGADPRARDHRRSHRERAATSRFIRSRRPRLRPVQHRLRPLPQLQGRQDRHLPERQPRPPRRGLRLRRHGRLGRRAGRVRHGPLRRLQPAQVPQQGAGDGEDQGPHPAQRHLPHRLPRRGHRRRRPGLEGLRRRGAGRSASPARPPATCSARRSSSSAT